MAGLTRVPVILVSGVQESAMLSACLSLQFGLPDAVAVRHAIDVGAQVLTRVVSDVTGIIEHEDINLAHACVSCVIREDIVPTLERLAATGRWRGIVACLPIAAEAIQVCRVVCWSPHNAPHVSVADLGGGPRRSRGCFWVPTRPDAVCVWDGAGGQASIGSRRTWNGRPPLTRIIVVGLDDGAAEITDAFHRCLLTDEELATRGRIWNEPWDGLEPWLGPTPQAA